MNRLKLSALVSNPAEYMDKSVFVAGWVRTVRDQKEFGFIELNDGSAFRNVQIVFTNALNNFEHVCKLTLGSSIAVKGTLIKSEGKGQAFEIKAEEIVIIGIADLENPIQKKKTSLEFLRGIPHLRPRTNTFKAVFKVRSLIAYAIHKFFQENGFAYIHTPIITGNDCEGAGEMFQVTTLDINNLPIENGQIKYEDELLGKRTFLTVSGQLAVEPFCMGFGDVYTFGPTFRAENSNTGRHANEFWMIEPEMAFADLNDNMRVAESMLKFIINYVLEKAPDEMAFFNQFIDNGLLARLDNIVKSDFGVITYTEAIDLLAKSGKKFEYKPEWGINLQTEHERYLAEEVFKKPVFVINYPKDIKAFYMKQNDDGKTVRAMDLLVPEIGEIIGGSQREEIQEKLTNRMVELGMKLEEYEWYMDTRRFGTFPHTGFGLGFERAVMYLTGMKNIRDVLPYPRTPNNAMF